MPSATSDLELLHSALVDRDGQAVARTLPHVTLGVMAARSDDGSLAPTRVRDASDRACLLAFLTHDAWQAFASDDDVLLVTGAELPGLIDRLEPELVVFNPAGPDPVEVDAALVAQLAAGEVQDEPGVLRVMDDLTVRPDAELTAALWRELRGVPDVARTVVGFQAIRGGRAHPTVGLRAGSGVSPEQIMRALQPASASLPQGLELTELSPETFDPVRSALGATLRDRG